MRKNPELNVFPISLSLKKTTLKNFDPVLFFTSYPQVYFKEESDPIALYATGAIAVFDNYPPLEPDSEIYLFFSGDSKSATLRVFIPKKIAFVSKEKIEVWEYSAPCIDYHYQQWIPPITTKASQYKKGVEQLKRLIHQQAIQKGVLAQVQSYPWPGDFSLRSLEKHPTPGTKFYFKYSNHLAFLGITPEWLYKRNQRSISIDALAGTTEVNDLKDLETSKIVEEFSVVKTGILHAIQNLIQEGKFAPIDTYKIHHQLAHRYNCFIGVLRDTVKDPDLILSLHPTPAIIGLPKNKALNAIHTLELFDRNYYASPIGYYTFVKARIAIALRCAILDDKMSYLYSGAGIVADSLAQKEWEETQKKLQLMKSLLALGSSRIIE